MLPALKEQRPCHRLSHHPQGLGRHLRVVHPRFLTPPGYDLRRYGIYRKPGELENFVGPRLVDLLIFGSDEEGEVPKVVSCPSTRVLPV